MNGLGHRQPLNAFSTFRGEKEGTYSDADVGRLLSTQSEVPQLRVYVTNDTSDVYEDKFAHVAHDESGRIQPTLILIGTRLGIDNVTPAYWDGLRAALTYPQSVGIAGYVYAPVQY